MDMLVYSFFLILVIFGYGYLFRKFYLIAKEHRKAMIHSNTNTKSLERTSTDVLTSTEAISKTGFLKQSSLNRKTMFEGTFSDKNLTSTTSLSASTNVQETVQQIIAGTSLDPSKSIESISKDFADTMNTQMKSPPIRPSKMNFVADSDILKDSRLFYDEDISKSIKLNKGSRKK